MGKRGPAPTPTAVLANRGSWRAKVRNAEPDALGSPVPPAWLAGDAAEMWGVLLAQLEGMGVVGEIDANALARYCQMYARWRECEAYIEQHGMMATTVVGDKEHPCVGRASRLADQLLKLEQQFGMTPSARAAMGGSQNNKKDTAKDGKRRFFNPKLTG